MSWRTRIIEAGYKRNKYKNFGSYKRKDRNTSNIANTRDSSKDCVFRGTYGFVQKNKALKKDDRYKHFNINSTKLRLKDIRCGVIAFNPECSKVLCICNKSMFDRFGVEQWGLPKGHMEEQDKVYSNCASRELYEETGVRYNILQEKFVFKRINNTIYYPIIIKEKKNLKQVDDNEILKVEWKDVTNLMKEDVTTKTHNQDMKVFLHRYFYDIKKLAKKNNEEKLKMNKIKNNP